MFDLGMYGKINAFVFVVLGNVDIDMNNFRIGGELINFSGDAVVKAGTGANEEVAVADRPVSGNRAVHAEPVQGERVLGIKGAQSHEGRGNRNAG